MSRMSRILRFVRRFSLSDNGARLWNRNFSTGLAGVASMQPARRSSPLPAAGIRGESGGDSDNSNRQMGSGIRHRPAVSPGNCISRVVYPPGRTVCYGMRRFPSTVSATRKRTMNPLPQHTPSSISHDRRTRTVSR